MAERKRVDAYFDIVMPDNWTPMFDANNTDEIAKVIKKEKPQIEKIVGHIQRKESGKSMYWMWKMHE